MIVTTKKRYCDRCQKEIEENRKYYKGWKITGDRIKIDGVKIKKKWEYTDDEELDLCDDCRKSLAKWMLEFSDDERRKEYYQK
jgi:hypothetical protein